MNLISIVNSGESIEKALSLGYCALRCNKDFYSQFRNIILFFDENLPKNNEPQVSHGSISAGMIYFKDDDNFEYKKNSDLWDDRIKILNILKNKKRISERVEEKLHKDYDRYIRVIEKIPAELILPKFYENLFDNLKQEYNNITVKKLNLRENFVSFLKNLPYMSCFAGKLYTLSSDGNIGSKTIDFQSNSNPNKENFWKKLSEDNVSSSGNVYVFLMKVKENITESKIQDVQLGYRKKSYINRWSFKYAIEDIEQNIENKIIEPSNSYFNELLQRNSEDKNDTLNDAIYQRLYEFSR